jgi:cytochrome c-type biogenesis protein CcmE
MRGVTDGGADRRPGRPLWKVLVISLVAVAATVYVIASGMQGAMLYALTIPELAARGSAAVGQAVRVQGTLVGRSVVYDASRPFLGFELRDGGHTLRVEYMGARPALFRDGAQVIVEGRLRPDSVFEAQAVLLKCPSRYESGGPADAAEAQQR